MSVRLWHSASTSEISGRIVGGGCNTLRQVGLTLLVLSNKSVEVVTTSNASVKCASEFSVHSGDDVPSYVAGSGRPLLAALMAVLSANVVLLPPGPYRGLLVLFRLKFHP